VFLILPTETLLQHAEFKALGPDPLVSADYEVEFPTRIRRASGRTVAAALLDQEIIAGVGNPLKCEILFATGLAPTTRVGDLLSSHVERLVAAASNIYRDAATAARRNEPFDYAVYDRAGEPCPKCGADIAVTRSAEETWFCPTCQPPLPTLFSPQSP
jgi:formamidopyrimidine-DNA glycosylase